MPRSYPYRRRYARRKFRSGYSIKKSFELNTLSYSNTITVPAVTQVPDPHIRFICTNQTAVAGRRTIKNFLLTISAAHTTAANYEGFPIFFGLVFAPSGTNVGQLILNVPNQQNVYTPLYSPQQHLILSGVVSTDQPPTITRAIQSRSLNQNDQIVLLATTPLVDPTSHADITVSFTLTYYISF